MERFCLDVRGCLEEATGMIDAMTIPPPPALTRMRGFEVADRLRSTCRRLGSARHCLYEWAEPDDKRSDADDHTNPPDAALTSQERLLRQARRAGRRNVRLWRDGED
jgi:hypothetical protein